VKNIESLPVAGPRPEEAVGLIPMRQHDPPMTGRRLVTREKLLQAGLRLFSKSGVDGTTIQEITSEAGVGFGSFYNHFKSKQDLADTLVEGYISDNRWIFETPEMKALDIAEYVSASVRFTLERAAADPDWGMFFNRTSWLMIPGRRGIVHALARDIRRGMRSGRFKVPDFDIALFSILGANNAWLLAELAGEINREAGSRIAAFTLQILGLGADEARTIARRPLPALMLKVLSSKKA
jgi:AcrR family transcriptional regulator